MTDVWIDDIILQMETPEEKRWKRINDVLLSEHSGSGHISVSSTRTLFGIKSHAEQVIERTVAEENAKLLEQMKAKREAEHEDGEAKLSN